MPSRMTPLHSLAMVCLDAVYNAARSAFLFVEAIDSASGFSLPADPEFWLSLFEEAKGWGLMTYELVFVVL